MNAHRHPQTDLSSEDLQILTSLTRDQFLELCDLTRVYGPVTNCRDALTHEAEVLLYLWR